MRSSSKSTPVEPCWFLLGTDCQGTRVQLITWFSLIEFDLQIFALCIESMHILAFVSTSSSCPLAGLSMFLPLTVKVCKKFCMPCLWHIRLRKCCLRLLFLLFYLHRFFKIMHIRSVWRLVCACECRGLWRLEATDLPRAGVTGILASPNMGAGNRTLNLCISVHALNHLAISLGTTLLSC